MSFISGWLPWLDDCHPWMTVITGWLSSLDDCHHRMNVMTGCLSSLDYCHPGWVTSLDDCHYWMTVINGWLSSLDDCHYWMTIITGWIRSLPHHLQIILLRGSSVGALAILFLYSSGFTSSPINLLLTQLYLDCITTPHPEVIIGWWSTDQSSWLKIYVAEQQKTSIEL